METTKPVQWNPNCWVLYCFKRGLLFPNQHELGKFSIYLEGCHVKLLDQFYSKIRYRLTEIMEWIQLVDSSISLYFITAFYGQNSKEFSLVSFPSSKSSKELLLKSGAQTYFYSKSTKKCSYSVEHTVGTLIHLSPFSFMRPLKAQPIALNSELHQTFYNCTLMERTHEFHTVRK